MGGSNQKPAQPSTPKNHTWGKKRVQLIVGGVAVCAALSLSGIAFAAAGGGSSVTWDAMEKEQPPVPIEQAEAPKAEADALPVTGAADKKDAQEQPKAEAPAEDKKPADEVAASVSNPVADGKNVAEEGSRGSNEPAGADVKGGADGKEPADAASDPQGDAQAEPAPEAPAAEDPTAQVAEAAPAKAVVKLSVEPADQGAVAYAGATYRDGDSIEAEAPADFALTVSPAEGYEVESVTVIRTAVPLEGADAPAAAPGAGQAAPLEADATGAYVVSADAEAATYQVSVTLKDARINSWENLKAALKQGGDVRLDDDIEAEGPLTITANTTLDLAGYTLSLPAGEASAVGGGALITVQSGIAFTLTDSTAAAPLKSQCRGEERGVPASEAGRLAFYDKTSHELTYYVTTTKTNRSAGTTAETRHEEHLDLKAAGGAIEASDVNALVAVEDGSTFTMSGGRLTNKNGAHAVKAGNSTVAIEGSAAIVGSGSASASGQDANGAGIYQAGGALTVGGSAVIAANVAANNGGGVYLADGKATIGGNAVVAGNKASEDAAETDGSNEHPDTYNGGGIYVAKAASLTVSENAVFSGNRARRDGGGIYVAPRLKDDSLGSAKPLVLAGATITNNCSDAVKERTGFYVSGGGGVFSMGDTAVDGAVITSNRAADAGGGLAMPGEAKYQMPLLAMTNTVVAANWAEASEGGGMFCMTSGRRDEDKVARLSYVTTGTYVTNNHTNTVFDYGGGGLFVPVDGFLNVVYPVVSGNKARGFGGGVGACSNSTVITQDAAIFDNKALGENHTTNPNEYGDRWAMLAEDKGPGPKGNDPGDRIWDMKSSAVVENTYDQYDSYNDYRTLKHAGWRNEKGEVEPLEANDFFSAHRATVYGTMLGGHDASCPENCESSHRSEYNWTGWMSASPAQGEAKVDYAKYGVAKVTLPGEGGQLGANSSGPRANNLGWYLWVKNSDFDEELALESAYKLDGASVELNSYQSGKSFRSSMTGFYELGLQNAPNLICLDFKRYADGGFMQNADGSSANNGLYLKADGSKLAPRELEAATRTEPLAYYRVYHIDKFPEGNGFAQANRIMALTADPSAAAKVSARSAACVFVTGNSSNTNGGGIGCNGFIHIGRPDPNVPDEPTTPDDPTHFGSFRIVKTLEGFLETEEGAIDGERATVVFHVVGYQDKESAGSGEGHNVIYDAYHALEFDANEEQKIVLGPFPAGSYFTVTEVSYSGANFEIADGESATRGVTIVANDDTQEGVVLPQVNFLNTYKDDGHKTSGVVNTYTKQDGSYTVTQKWSKTQVVVPEPAEGDEPQTPADES